jgi:membrane protein required for colicin V production
VNWFDLIIIVLVLISAVDGFNKGFVRIGIGFGAMIVGFLLAAWNYRAAGALLESFIHSKTIANLVGFFIIFGLVGIAGALVAALIARGLKLIGVGFFDRLGGIFFGAVQGALVTAVIIMILLAFPRKPPVFIVQSHFAPYLVGAAQTLSRATPYEVRDGFRQTYDELQRVWEEVVKKHNKEKLPEDHAILGMKANA